MAPVCGIRSDTQRPDWPYCLKSLIGRMTMNALCALDMAETLLWPLTEAGSSWPCILMTVGL